jgi:cytochrome c551/c552
LAGASAARTGATTANAASAVARRRGCVLMATGG